MTKHTGTDNSKSAAPAASRGRFARSSLPFIGAIVSLLLILELLAIIIDKPFIMPHLPEIISRFFTQFGTAKFWETLLATLQRLAIGYPLACVLGGVLGLIAGISKSFAVYLRSVITILQSIPPITWLPFFIIIYGFGNVPIIAVITIASFFPMALSVMNATEGVNRTHLELARVMGASKSQLLRKVFWPETMPAFITGAQLSFGNSWRSMIAAEMVGGASVGLGFTIRYAGDIADMEGVLASIMVIGAIALFLDSFLLERLKRRLLKYRYVMGGDR